MKTIIKVHCKTACMHTALQKRMNRTLVAYLQVKYLLLNSWAPHNNLIRLSSRNVFNKYCKMCFESILEAVYSNAINNYVLVLTQLQTDRHADNVTLCSQTDT